MDVATAQLVLLYVWLAGALYFVVSLGRITSNLVTALANVSDTSSRLLNEMTQQLREAAGKLSAVIESNVAATGAWQNPLLQDAE